MLLKNTNVFLTGGSRGLGQAAVLELVKFGANVAFTYIKCKDGAENTTRKALEINPLCKIKTYQMDVKDSKNVDYTVEKVINDFEKIDVVVNNAGILNDSPIYKMTDEQWNEIIQIHLSGTFYVCRAFLYEFIMNKGGKFINVSSISCRGSVGQANYSAAKAGIIGLSKSIANEYGNKNIYCNAIMAGFFKTDMTDANASDIFVENAINLSMLQRTGHTDEFGKVVVFFASDLSSFVNGTTLNVSGGIQSIPPFRK